MRIWKRSKRNTSSVAGITGIDMLEREYRNELGDGEGKKVVYVEGSGGW
jgi:hypothetical protein